MEESPSQCEMAMFQPAIQAMCPALQSAHRHRV
jgi:hypothetical protein